jgi:hypothetical protein
MPHGVDHALDIRSMQGTMYAHAHVGVHGKPVELHMEKLWDHNISLTTRLVDTATIPMLLKVVESGKLQPSKTRSPGFSSWSVAHGSTSGGFLARSESGGAPGCDKGGWGALRSLGIDLLLI